MTKTSPIDQLGAQEADLGEALLDGLARLARPAPAAAGVFEEAAARALAACRAHEDADAARSALLLPFAGDVLAELALEFPWEDGLDALVEELAVALGRDADVVAVELHARACRNPSLVALPPATALAMQVRIARAFARVETLSLWTVASVGGITCVAHAGEAPPPKRPPATVRRALRLGRGPATGTGGLLACPVSCWQRTIGAVFMRPGASARPVAATIAVAAADGVSPLLERHVLLHRNAESERALVAATERRLARLGFDLHDGPIQDVIALAGDLRVFRAELERASFAARGPLLARVDEFEHRLHELDASLRELCESLDAPAIAGRPLALAIETEAKTFANRTGIRADVDLRGPMDGLSASQRIALVRFVQEALNNVREHSGATHVRVTLGVRRGVVSAAVTDNGDGFRVEQTLVRAATAGRFGLVGMSERARLLGGRFDIASEPGGPTTVTIVLPPWQPSAVATAAAPRAG